MEFAIEDYKQRTGRLRGRRHRLRRVPVDQPLDADTLRCLRYMHDVELHTVCYLRDLLLTPGPPGPGDHDVPDVLELRGVLARRGDRPGARRPRRSRRATSAWPTCASGSAGATAIRPTLTTLSSATVGRAYIAVHMTWGVINEWSTQAGYARLVGQGAATRC